MPLLLKKTTAVVSTSTGFPPRTYGLYFHCFTAFSAASASSKAPLISAALVTFPWRSIVITTVTLLAERTAPVGYSASTLWMTNASITAPLTRILGGTGSACIPKLHIAFTINMTAARDFRVFISHIIQQPGIPVKNYLTTVLLVMPSRPYPAFNSTSYSGNPLSPSRHFRHQKMKEAQYASSSGRRQWRSGTQFASGVGKSRLHRLWYEPVCGKTRAGGSDGSGAHCRRCAGP